MAVIKARKKEPEKSMMDSVASFPNRSGSDGAADGEVIKTIDEAGSNVEVEFCSFPDGPNNMAIGIQTERKGEKPHMAFIPMGKALEISAWLRQEMVRRASANVEIEVEA